MFEYKVIPAPIRGKKAPGVKGPGPRFALALEDLINELAAEGWEYQRSDILPSEERQGLTSSHTVYRSVMVFRRALAVDIDTARRMLPGVETGMAQPDMVPDGQAPHPRSDADETANVTPEDDGNDPRRR